MGGKFDDSLWSQNPCHNISQRDTPSHRPTLAVAARQKTLPGHSRLKESIMCVCVSRAHRRRRPRPRRLEYPSPRPLSIPPHSHPPGLCDLVGILGDALHRVGDPIARRLGEVVPVSVPRRVPVRTFGVGGWDGSTRWTGVLKETKDPRDPRDLRDPRGLSLCVACLGWWSRNPPPKSRPSHRGEARPGFGGPYR